MKPGELYPWQRAMLDDIMYGMCIIRHREDNTVEHIPLTGSRFLHASPGKSSEEVSKVLIRRE